MDASAGTFNTLSNIMTVAAVVLGFSWRRVPISAAGRWILFGVVFTLAVAFKLAARGAMDATR